jgi:hypothetical protein
VTRSGYIWKREVKVNVNVEGDGSRLGRVVVLAHGIILFGLCSVFCVLLYDEERDTLYSATDLRFWESGNGRFWEEGVGEDQRGTAASDLGV